MCAAPARAIRTNLVVGALLVSLVTILAAQEDPPWLAKLKEWLTAVDRHEPGTEDAPARTINSWPRRDLQELEPYIQALADLLSHPGDRRIAKPARAFRRNEVQALEKLAQFEVIRGDPARVMKRGALLHADIAMLLKSRDTSAPAIPPPPSPPGRRFPPGAGPSPQPRPIVRSVDGRFESLENPALHWQIGRMLLDFAAADPANDGFIRLWYRATSAYMAGKREHATAGPHLFRARTLFPDDADLFFQSGGLYEALAAPSVQTVIKTTTLPGGLTFDVATEQVNLERAEIYLRRALEIDPDFVEARMRFGRVLGLQGKHPEAAQELLRAQGAASERLLAYYANLFLGAEYRALGRHEDARRHYMLARAIFPNAQSPHLGVSQLARERGDRAEAQRAIEPVLTVTSDEERRNDPWWDYNVAQGRRADALFVELRKPFQRGPGQ